MKQKHFRYFPFSFGRQLCLFQKISIVHSINGATLLKWRNTMPFSSQWTEVITSTADETILTFFGAGEEEWFHCIYCLFVSDISTVTRAETFVMPNSLVSIFSNHSRDMLMILLICFYKKLPVIQHNTVNTINVFIGGSICRMRQVHRLSSRLSVTLLNSAHTPPLS